MSVVRAKFFVSEIRFTSWGGGVTLQAVCRGEDNKEWASATPTGTITMGISNALALVCLVERREAFKPRSMWRSPIGTSCCNRLKSRSHRSIRWRGTNVDATDAAPAMEQSWPTPLGPFTITASRQLSFFLGRAKTMSNESRYGTPHPAWGLPPVG